MKLIWGQPFHGLARLRIHGAAAVVPKSDGRLPVTVKEDLVGTNGTRAHAVLQHHAGSRDYAAQDAGRDGAVEKSWLVAQQDRAV
eukprot:CAMPEP_0115081592 /NCGR_PEP_ID=MMETSP0227-20121206/19370_1 /TAXON_ID=89957 /ORGANISM="Polarella glacialis, Strain CCMP 1383" /LENGTH=84 /DNA_ID=CAMNT_0002469465 /DNA_START=522 /DNA_END=776 /DNA_ORIENTATION=-